MAACDLPHVGSRPAATSRAGSPTLSAQLEEIHDQLRQVSMEAAALAASLSDAQFWWKPSAHAWSVGECLGHLTATARLCMPRLDDAISRGIAAGAFGQGPFRYGWLDRCIVRAAEPPSRWHVTSPQAFLPVSGIAREDVLDAFHAAQDQLIDRLGRADGLHLTRVRVASPVVPWHTFALGAAFSALAAHERRHLWQARRVAAHPHFPR